MISKPPKAQGELDKLDPGFGGSWKLLERFARRPLGGSLVILMPAEMPKLQPGREGLGGGGGWGAWALRNTSRDQIKILESSTTTRYRFPSRKRYPSGPRGGGLGGGKQIPHFQSSETSLGSQSTGAMDHGSFSDRNR